MLSAFSPLPSRQSPNGATADFGETNLSTRKADCFGSHVVLTSLLSSCGWFTARVPAQTRTGPLHCAMPPADNSTGFCACTLYLVFKEPTCRHPVSPLRRRRDTSVADRSPRPASPSVTFWRDRQPFLGEPFEVTTEDLTDQQKNCSEKTTGAKAELCVVKSIYAPGVGLDPFGDSTSADIG